MAKPPSKQVLAVVSPFIDKRHGTERHVAEWTSRLTEDYDVHVYSQRAEDLDLTKLTWHCVPEISGPHIGSFVWWLAANHIWRWWDRTFRAIRRDLIFTPGTNCLDADAISIHFVFAEFVRQMRPELTLRRNAVRSWPRLVHRRIYYRPVVALQRHLYTRAQLILIARETVRDLDRFYGPRDDLPLVYMGIDDAVPNPGKRLAQRDAARKKSALLTANSLFFW